MQALRRNPRIDGLFIYLGASSAAQLAARMRNRPREAESTLTKRAAWAAQQISRSMTPGLFDGVITSTTVPEVGTVAAGASSCTRALCLVHLHLACMQTALLPAVPSGLCSAQGGHILPQPCHPQPAAWPARLRAGLC